MFIELFWIVIEHFTHWWYTLVNVKQFIFKLNIQDVSYQWFRSVYHSFIIEKVKINS